MRCPNHEASSAPMGRDVRTRSMMSLALQQDHGDRDNPMCTRAEYDEVKDQLRVVQEENCKLQAIITDVTAVNKRWQRYNNDRQLYVQSLLSTIHDLQEHVNTMVGQQVFSSKDAGVEKGRSVLLEEQVDSLQHKLEVMEKQHREHVEVLELQLKSYRDDWEAEHREKQQAAHDKLLAERRACELELELRCLKRKLEAKHGSGAAKHCECCRLSASSDPPLANGHPGRTYRTSAQLPTASEHFQSYNDNLEIDGNKQRGKSGSCSNSSTAASCLPGSGCNAPEVQAGRRSSSERSGAKPLPADGAPKLNLPPAPRRDAVATKLNIVREAPPRCDRSANAVTIGFTSDGRAAVTTFANFPVAKSSSLPPAGRVSAEASTSSPPPPPLSASASDNVGRLASWLPGLEVATPPRSAEVPKRHTYPSETSSRRRKANYYEEGVATQTEENIVCPGCGHVFPPKQQVEFLDHFELCQSK